MNRQKWPTPPAEPEEEPRPCCNTSSCVTVTIIVAVLIAGATTGVLLFLARGRMEGEEDGEEESTE